MITLINSFRVPGGREADFIALWEEVNRYMRAKPGYLRHRLHRAQSPDASFAFVNVADWETHADFTAAHDDGFFALVRRPEWAEFPSVPALFDVVHEGSSAVRAAPVPSP